MNKKYFVISIDGLLKTLSPLDADEGVAFRSENEAAVPVQVGDCVLGFIAHGVDEFRMAFIAEDVTDGVVLSKKIEKAVGVAFSQFEDQLLPYYADFSEPGKITELPTEIGKEIEQCLSGEAKRVAKIVSEESLQRIIYGAPGTGKSWEIEDMLKSCPERVVRTTFHPDSDYSTFVGAYKPTMKTVPRLAMVGKTMEKVSFGAGFSEDEKKELQFEDKIVYKFIPQAFTKAYAKAWKAQADARAKSGETTPDAIYLVIEEINRGNCAQVFGDIFQLLDRENGYSKYAVKADEDLCRYLAEEFKDLDFGEQYKLVQSGEDLILPPNLYIWATMNTSDQSLFPMDSAFKRRWDWEYKPIVNEGKDWAIVVHEKVTKEGGAEEDVETKYDWWKFLTAVNDKIFKLTDSEDKKLGYYFVKPDGEGAMHKGTISAKTFVGKVIFYLWNDVYKDYGIAEIFKGDQNGETAEDKKLKGVAYEAFYEKDGKTVAARVLKNFFEAVGVKPE